MLGNKRGPVIGEPAPIFESTIADNKITLKDFRGKWVILFSHPEDLLPLFRTRTINYVLCKRRIRAVALADGQTDNGVSGKNFIKKYIIKHCLTSIDDTSKEISRLYGLEADSGEGTHAVKGVFVIDPEGILRIRLFFSPDTERNFHEILGLVDALQATEKQKSGHTKGKDWRRQLGIVIKPRPVAE